MGLFTPRYRLDLVYIAAQHSVMSSAPPITQNPDIRFLGRLLGDVIKAYGGEQLFRRIEYIRSVSVDRARGIAKADAIDTGLEALGLDEQRDQSHVAVARLAQLAHVELRHADRQVGGLSESGQLRPAGPKRLVEAGAGVEASGGDVVEDDAAPAVVVKQPARPFGGDPVVVEHQRLGGRPQPGGGLDEGGEPGGDLSRVELPEVAQPPQQRLKADRRLPHRVARREARQELVHFHRGYYRGGARSPQALAASPAVRA